MARNTPLRERRGLLGVIARNPVPSAFAGLGGVTLAATATVVLLPAATQPGTQTGTPSHPPAAPASTVASTPGSVSGMGTPSATAVPGPAMWGNNNATTEFHPADGPSNQVRDALARVQFLDRGAVRIIVCAREGAAGRLEFPGVSGWRAQPAGPVVPLRVASYSGAEQAGDAQCATVLYDTADGGDLTGVDVSAQYPDGVPADPSWWRLSNPNVATSPVADGGVTPATASEIATCQQFQNFLSNRAGANGVPIPGCSGWIANGRAAGPAAGGAGTPSR